MMSHIIGFEYLVRVHLPFQLSEDCRKKLVAALIDFMERLEKENGTDWFELNDKVRASSSSFEVSILRSRHLHGEEVEEIGGIIRQILSKSMPTQELLGEVSISVYQPPSNVSAFC